MAIKLFVFEGTGLGSRVVLPYIAANDEERVNFYYYLAVPSGQLAVDFMDWSKSLSSTMRGKMRAAPAGMRRTFEYDGLLFITSSHRYGAVETELRQMEQIRLEESLGQDLPFFALYPQAMRGIPPTMRSALPAASSRLHFYYSNTAQLRVASGQVEQQILLL